MRAWAFILLLLITLTLQGVVAPKLQWGAARPDFMLLLAVFLSLHASRAMRLCGGWIVGAACDCASIEPFGIFTLGYGLAGLALAVIRERVFIYHLLVQFALVAGAGGVFGAILFIYRAFVWPATWQGVGAEVWMAMTGVLYTAVAAPLVFSPLLSGSRWLGIPAPGYRARRAEQGPRAR